MEQDRDEIAGERKPYVIDRDRPQPAPAPRAKSAGKATKRRDGQEIGQESGGQKKDQDPSGERRMVGEHKNPADQGKMSLHCRSKRQPELSSTASQRSEQWPKQG